VVVLGWVTGLLCCLLLDEVFVLDVLSSLSPSPLRCDPELAEPDPAELEPWEPEPGAWLVWEVPVWVVRPRPTAAPRALTTLSPARPACSRRLRLICLMSSLSARGLWPACESTGTAVSVT
jgi:hypothetical protein